MTAAQARLAALRNDGSARFDPARFQYLEALARRLPGQSEPVRRLLQDQLQRGLVEYAARVERRQQDARREAEALLSRHPTLGPQLRRLQATGDVAAMRRLVARAEATAASAPLARLNASFRPGAEVAGAGDELESARRFREAWSRSQVESRLDQAAARRPANAGPLNSHALVLNALGLVRELSPDYLRSFLSQIESLQWLDRATAQQREKPKPKAVANKPRKRK